MDMEKELLSAAEKVKFKLKKGEDRQGFLVRLMKAISKVENEDWEALSTEAQDWTNAAALAYNEGSPIKEFDGNVADDPGEVAEAAEIVPGGERGEVFEEVQSQDEVEVAEEVPATPVRGRAGSTRNSACHLVKMWVVKNPQISVKDIAGKLKSKGLKVSDVTIASLRSSVRDTLRVMRDLNMIEVKL